MAARALEELDTGLGSLQAAVVSRRADAGSWPLDLAAEGSLAGGEDVGPKKPPMEPASQTDPGLGKEKLRAAPRSPARRKTQPAPPAQPPPLPPPPPPPREEPLWGALSLNKCLVVASLVALLGSGFQLCRDAVIRVANAPAPGVPPSSAPKEPEVPAAAPVLQETRSSLPPPPAPAAGTEEREDAAGSEEAAEKEEEDIAEPAGEEDPAPLLAPEPKKEKRRKEQAPRRERPRQERPRRDSGLRKEKPRAAREPRRAREPEPWPRARASGDPEPRKRPAWASRHHSDEEEDRRLGRKHRVGKGRD